MEKSTWKGGRLGEERERGWCSCRWACTSAPGKLAELHLSSFYFLWEVWDQYYLSIWGRVAWSLKKAEAVWKSLWRLGLRLFLISTEFLFNDFIYLRGKGGKKRGRETLVQEMSIGCLSHAPSWRPGPQHRHGPWLQIEPVTFCFAGWHSVHWATPARARNFKFPNMFL